jgi:hypothetical protein
MIITFTLYTKYKTIKFGLVVKDLGSKYEVLDSV